MKTIDTLRDDIYDLFRKPHDADPGRLEGLARDLSTVIGRRLAEERGPSYLRMSNLGKGDRQLWYEINRPDLKTEELSPANKIKFLFGDILEHLLLFLAEEAGHDVQNRQLEVEVEGIKGSIDATIDGVLVDTKSASTPSFKRFERHGLVDDDPFGYQEQLAGYREGLQTDDAAFLVIDKTLGNIHLDLYKGEELDGLRIRDRALHAKAVVSSEEVPERCHPDEPYGKSGNMVLGTNCSYCPFKTECWKDANGGIGLRTFIYAKGPVHFTQVVKEPDVYEVTF